MKNYHVYFLNGAFSYILQNFGTYAQPKTVQIKGQTAAVKASFATEKEASEEVVKRNKNIRLANRFKKP